MYGPVIILSIESKEPVQMLKPAILRIHIDRFSRIKWKDKENFRMLYSDAPYHKWIDSTDNIPYSVRRNGDIIMWTNHFSM